MVPPTRSDAAMKLYVYEHCPFCCRTLLVRGLKQLDIPVEVIMEGDADTPTRLVGKKVVPILRKADGSHMSESMDIVRYLDEAFPPRTITAAPVPAIDDWAARAFKPAITLAVPRFTRGDFAELATPQARAAYTERETRAFGDLQALLDSTDEQVAALQPLLDELEGIVPPPGGAIGESDFLLFPILRSLSIVKAVRLGPKAQAWYDALHRTSGVPDFSDQAS